LIETGSALLIVLASISLLRFVLVRGGFNAKGGRGNAIEIETVQALSSRQRLCLVRVEGKGLLVGSSEAGITLLGELGDAPADSDRPDSDAAPQRDAGDATRPAAGPAGWTRLSRSLRTLTFLALVLTPALASAQAAPASATGAETIAIDLPGLTGPDEISSTLEIVALMTLVSIAPALLLMATCFTRIVIVLALLRQAIGLQQLPPNQVLVGLALFTTLFVMAPIGERIRSEAYEPYVAQEIDASTATTRAVAPVRRFLSAHTRESDLALFASLQKSEATKTSSDEISLFTLLPAFMISELRTAFEIGFLVYLPFLVIDLVIASMLISMGMIVLPPIVISLPFKLMLFVLMDGWNRVISSLVMGLS